MNRILLIASGLACVGVSACATAGRGPGVTADPCLVAEGASDDSIDVLLPALPSPAGAPAGAGAVERLVFRQLYATVLRVDCTGALRPGLAVRWSEDDGGRLWRLELDDRRFADGSPITAQHIVTRWAREGLAAKQPWLTRVEAPGPRTIAIRFTEPGPGSLERLADPSLAVAGAEDEHGWPSASGDFTLEHATDSLLVIVPREGRAPVVRIHRFPSSDGRDQLEAGSDLVVTRDPRTIEYAERVPALAVAPLPWDRAYFLVSPTIPPLDLPSDSADRARFRESLARDAVQGSARGAGRDRLPAPDPACRTGFPAAGRPRNRIVYPAGDLTAQRLAERLVAVAPARLTVAALPPAELAESMRMAGDIGFVVPFDPGPAVSCGALPPLPAGATLEPLVETRAHLILRRGSANVTVDADGVPRVRP